jgi:hypothetical protein
VTPTPGHPGLSRSDWRARRSSEVGTKRVTDLWGGGGVTTASQISQEVAGRKGMAVEKAGGKRDGGGEGRWERDDGGEGRWEKGWRWRR